MRGGEAATRGVGAGAISPVIASAAKQSIAASGEVDCFASLAMTWILLHDLAAHCARGVLDNFHAPYSEGAGKTGCTLHPRSRVRLRTENAHASRALVLSTFRVHRIPPHVRDDRDPPLYRLSGIFFRKGLDRFLLICPTGKLMEGFAVLPYYGPHISGFCRPLGLLANDPAAQPADAVLASSIAPVI